MPPPPVHFFLGRTVSAREQPGRSSPLPLLGLQARGGHAFTEPPATAMLLVPPETLVSAVARRLADPAWSALDLVGEMSRVDRPCAITLAPLATEDAEGLAHALAARYALPRIPVDVTAPALASLCERTLVRVEGVYAHARSWVNAKNFEGVVALSASGLVLRDGARLRVIGFLEPADPRPAFGPPLVLGYAGPKLNAIHVEEIG